MVPESRYPASGLLPQFSILRLGGYHARMIHEQSMSVRLNALALFDSGIAANSVNDASSTYHQTHSS